LESATKQARIRWALAPGVVVCKGLGGFAPELSSRYATFAFRFASRLGVLLACRQSFSYLSQS
jgi:hypothetical protein